MIMMKPLFAFLLLLAALASAEFKYDPAKLPKGHDYFELRDGLANCQRKFTQEKTAASFSSAARSRRAVRGGGTPAITL
jgi:hypothetical protein